MRALSVLTLNALVSAALAQQPPGTLPDGTANPEVLIWNAYTNLQEDSPFELSLSGTETVNGSTKSFLSNLFWTTGTDPRNNAPTLAKVELDDYESTTGLNSLVRRYVGDGRTLWFYDMPTPPRNQPAAYRYNGSTYTWLGATSSNYVGSDAPRLLAQLYAEARGPSAYLVRLLREVNPVNPASTTYTSALFPSRYDSWAPGLWPFEPPTSPAVQDPLVSSWQYSQAGATYWILYNWYRDSGATKANNSNANRSVAFQITDTGTSGVPHYTLTSINFAEQSPNRFVQWQMTVTDPAILPANTFVPYPAPFTRTWQLVPAPSPTG